MFARPFDRVALLVEQMLDFKNRLYILPPVHPMVRSHLLRGHGGKLRLPVAQYMLLQPCQSRDFPDAKIQLCGQLIHGTNPRLQIPRIKLETVSARKTQIKMLVGFPHLSQAFARSFFIYCYNKEVNLKGGGVTDSTGWMVSFEACRAPGSRKTTGKTQLPTRNLLTLLNS